MTMTRRHLLVGAAVLTLMPQSALAAPGDETEAMLALLPDRDAAARLGGLWIAQEPAEPNAVLDRLNQRLRPDLRQSLADAIADDFRNGAVVKVDGWQIARTQAELCALAYFAAANRL